MLQPRPIVGVIACNREVEGEPAQAVKRRYLEAVEQHAEAIPLIVPSNQSPANVTQLVTRLDAVMLTGSNSNVAPHRYGSDQAGRTPMDEGRDEVSQALIRAAIMAAKPVFGICRGMQEINVALGGTLRDLRENGLGGQHHAPPDASLEETFAFEHEIDVVTSSTLHRYADDARLTVNSVHFQAIERLGEGLVVNATGPDGIIEAVSASHTPAPVFAVQWHPEWRPAGRPHDIAFWHYLGEVARSRYIPTSEMTA